jgi:hypothetical protein
VRRITERIDLAGEKGSGLFIGVQVMEPTIFARMPASERFEIVPGLVPAFESGPIASWVQPRAARWPVGCRASSRREPRRARGCAAAGVLVDSTPRRGQRGRPACGAGAGSRRARASDRAR